MKFLVDQPLGGSGQVAAFLRLRRHPHAPGLGHARELAAPQAPDPHPDPAGSRSPPETARPHGVGRAGPGRPASGSAPASGPLGPRPQALDPLSAIATISSPPSTGTRSRAGFQSMSSCTTAGSTNAPAATGFTGPAATSGELPGPCGTKWRNWRTGAPTRRNSQPSFPALLPLHRPLPCLIVKIKKSAWGRTTISG